MHIIPVVSQDPLGLYRERETEPVDQPRFQARSRYTESEREGIELFFRYIEPLIRDFSIRMRERLGFQEQSEHSEAFYPSLQVRVTVRRPSTHSTQEEIQIESSSDVSSSSSRATGRSSSLSPNPEPVVRERVYYPAQHRRSRMRPPTPQEIAIT
ncbi:MAG TPA: hypothetical protein P5048_03990 [Chlamydiales bacterium]|nr:hypothetical protein [Chlamydiales bacterium]